MTTFWNKDGKRWRGVAIALSCMAQLLLISSTSLAQTTTVTPASVEAAKPQQVVLRIAKADGASDSAMIGQVQTITVGGQPVVSLSKDEQGITITPPVLSPGKYDLQLFDSAGKQLGEQVQIEYQGGVNVSAPVGNRPGTSANDMALQRERHEESRREKLVTYNWYYFLVTLMFLSVLVPFVVAIYRGTSGSRTTDNRPLGLPVGSFRSILAYSLVAYLGFYVLTSILSISNFAPPEFLLGIVATVIGFYFGSRSGEDGEPSSQIGAVRGIVRQGTSPTRGALIKFTRSDDGTDPYSRISDADGRFELTGIRPGKYKVGASLPGSASAEQQEISVTRGSDHEIEIVIKGDASPPAAQSGTVLGTVTKTDGTPAPQATVILSQVGVEKFKKLTDAAGEYKFDTVLVGEYDLEASLEPYIPSGKIKVTVTPGGQHIEALKLK